MSLIHEDTLRETVRRLCMNYKGILAADESIGTIGKRFSDIEVENNHDNRYNYRDLLFSTPQLNNYISGVITYEETLYDERDGKRLVQSLFDQGIIVGLKTDLGLVPFPTGEKRTNGLDDLAERSKRAFEAGARFAKWRCVYEIDPQKGWPTSDLILQNSQTLAQYAKVSQECGLVPIVEPEVLMDKCDDITTSEKVTREVLSSVYRELIKSGVRLELTLLKPNMVRTKDADLNDIANRTLCVLRDTVPVSVPGVVFLSGGMSEDDAATALKLINQKSQMINNIPWRLSFSYGRALQQSVLQTWKGNDSNNESAQLVLYQKARINGCASHGVLDNMENLIKL